MSFTLILLRTVSIGLKVDLVEFPDINIPIACLLRFNNIDPESPGSPILLVVI
ncbi:hypothetical protein [Clostridium novyi]|uniref:hypothetical protein n=1 Tax=Clostridium novyi TaxID=1542 RepID=UPI0030844A6F